MSGSVNKVILVGHLGRDPEIRTFQSGDKVATLRLATSESWRDKGNGERRERTEWHTVGIYDENLVKIAEQYLKKGALVFIEGQLETRKWQDKDGNDRYSTEVVLRPYRGSLTMLGGKNEGGGDSGQERGSGKYDNPNYKPGSGSARPDMDDEIPL